LHGRIRPSRISGGIQSQYKPLAVDRDESPLRPEQVHHVPFFEIFGWGWLTEERNNIVSMKTDETVRENEPVRDPMAPMERVRPVSLAGSPPPSAKRQGCIGSPTLLPHRRQTSQ